ncbi:HAUS augmin-like complex subunit 5 [Alosa sapidissima]|uniref:HAUS augmin-like complex subunit 5 n=1 Tax=Alosa sapidissima TaxID=34773 RepID=UPI001C093859|nr:HAUS augmin-like complex subunit 5 [Alosa sapidissima]
MLCLTHVCLTHPCVCACVCVSRACVRVAALVERVRCVDEELQRVVLPRATEALQLCNKGLDSCTQVRTAIKHWWEQPAQFALPDMCVEGKTFLQWLYRWKRATKKHEV